VSKEETPKILVVNDDPRSLLALVGLLSSWKDEIDYEVMTATSGEETLRQSLYHDFAVILLDVNMPGMDGFETAEAIHARPRSASTPIIFVTAYLADEMTRFKGYQTGAVDYLFTPIIPQILKAKLTVFVGLARNSLQLKRQTDALNKRTSELVAINERLEFEINERRIAENQNRTKDEFLAMLGHELRNPLSAICSAASLIDAVGIKPASIDQAKAVIRRQSQHLSRIVDDLLDLSRVMSGKVVLNRQSFEISALVANCLETLALTGRTQNYAVSIQTEPVWIHGDITRVEQIVTNLLDNAVKYTPAGGKIRIEVKIAGDQVELLVHDSGIGMPPSLVPQVFDLFVQGEQTPGRAQGGLGIGLALVSHLIRLHSGSITAHSEGVGRGSSFVVRLPKDKLQPSASPAPAILAPQGSYHILLVEDNHDAREMISTLLSTFGHRVIEAKDGMQGVQMAGAHKPDVIVVDIGLPDIDGHEVARRLRACADTSAIPLIALTGYGLEQDRKNALEAGFDIHLVKPVNTDALMEAIENCISRVVKA
jgi:signal transduction histidine kinase